MSTASSCSAPSWYAYVRFMCDMKRHVVRVRDIKNFYPEHLSDFSKTRPYAVKWMSEKNPMENSYYQAQILGLAETEKQAEALQKKRIAVPPPRIGSELDVREESSSNDEPAETAKLQRAILKKRTDEVKKKKERDLVAESRKRYASTSVDDEGVVAESELKEARQEVKTLEQRVKKLQEQNDKLQAALVSGVLNLEKPSGHQSRAVQNLEPFHKVTNLNTCFSQYVSQSAEEEDFSLSEEWNETESVTQLETPDKLKEGPLMVDHSQSSEPSKEAVVVDNGQIHLGNEVWLPCEKYEHLLAIGAEKKAARDAAVSIFSTAGLLDKSITGLPSNRFVQSGAVGKECVD
ncbi:BEN domain-containing protein 5-like [Ornithodoros turicata]|uniref:BEN domain-containing protein 5-like n=1 Tax=Ornithodoros turicata TaxID=34597 RepID=UPI003138A7FD